MKYRLPIFTALFLLISGNIESQEAFNKEEEVPFKTYQYSDPDPVPHANKIYPYFRYDGYTDIPVLKKWKVISLENEYIKLWVFPEIGGKIWGAIEKATGNEFLYFNHVVKFRDVALRGPWTSGGLEMNFGIFGHAPTCSSPVDYLIRKNDDGSVSCFVGAMDLTSRTRWSVEINLPKDKAYFTTRCTWDNPTMLQQSYYQWMNAGIKVKGDLEYTFPGNHYIDHDGKYFNWPADEENRDLSLYKSNNFGTYKSYHTFGSISGFYGAYWKNDDFGFGHFSEYDEKPGKKIWIWGLSDQGMIWEHLLTDSDGQYSEVQSGRLFNQAAAGSSFSPFKNMGFAPGSTDEWIEYWYPVKDIHGLKNSIPEGSVNLIKDSSKLNLFFCPNVKTTKNLIVKENGKTIYSYEISLAPMQIFSTSFDYNGGLTDLEVTIGEDVLYKSEMDTFARPIKSPEGFDWESMFGTYLKAREYERQRLYNQAVEYYARSLQKEPFFINSLTGISRILYRQTDYRNSLRYSTKALSIDTYDPEANMMYGLSALALGDTASAIDAFSIASHSFEYRVAAYNSLAEIYIRKGNFRKAIEFADKSLKCNVLGTEAMQVKMFCFRKLGITNELVPDIEKLFQRDPLNHYIRFEQYLTNPVKENEILVKSYIKNEFPSEAYLEAALWYYKVGQIEDALKILDISSENPESVLWKAYLNHLLCNDAKAETDLNRALNLSSEMVFPSRPESMKPLEWAQSLSNDWKLNYYKGLIYLSSGAYENAVKCWDKCGDLPSCFPFYAARSELRRSLNIDNTNDIAMILKTGINEWRAGWYAATYYLNNNEPEKALEVIKEFYNKFPENQYLGSLYARILFFSKDYPGCTQLLCSLKVLPYEGASELRDIWKMANLGRAMDLMKSGKYKAALRSIDQARDWPVNLGTGKPYEPDERLENFISLHIFMKIKDQESALIHRNKILDYPECSSRINTNDLFYAWLLRENGEKSKADQVMTDLLAEQSQSRILQWCNAIYFNGIESAGSIEKEIGGTDYTFIILKKLFDEVLSKP